MAVSGIAIVVVLGLLVALDRSPPATGPAAAGGGGIAVGSVAPDFSLPNVLSTASHPLPPVVLDVLGSDRHRPVVLNFYASWCTPCRRETPLLAAAARTERAERSPVQFVGVDVADNPAAAIPFLRQAGVSYPVGADAELRVATAVYHLSAEPDTFFIGASGVVVGRHLGALDAVELRSWLRVLNGSHA